MTDSADVIVVGAGVQGASLAFHLARRGASVLILERGVVAAGATGRSSGFVRVHYVVSRAAMHVDVHQSRGNNTFPEIH